MYSKDYNVWNNVKKGIDSSVAKVSIRTGEIRWIAVGVNIGSEIDGKGASFARPGLVLRVIGTHLALIVPLSSVIKFIPGNVPLIVRGAESVACIHHMRSVSQKRIFSRIEKLSDEKLRVIKNTIKEFYRL